MRDDGYLAKYPTRAADLLTRMDAAYETDRQALQTLVGQYNAESTVFAGSPQIRSLQEEAAAMLGRVDNVRSQGRSMAAMARSQSADAANLRREGDRLLSEARAAFARSDFETALRRLESASTAYDRSLDQEDDEETWRKRLSEIPSLNTIIVEAYNRDIIRQVDELVDRIENTYYSNDFDQAEQLLSRAENLWKITQTIENPKLTHWAGMIQLGLRAGTTIPPTAPLYAEMSQLLSDARKNFEDGRILILTSLSEGRQMLNNAKASIHKVKLVYPMNSEAGILDLRIDEVLDEKFRDTLDAKIQTARTRARTGNPSQRIQAVNELRNFRTVFPDHTNWDPIIRQAEEDAGLRRPAPTPQQIQEAQQIVNSVRDIIRSGNINRIQETLPQLQRAMTLDPNNREANDLFRDVTTRISRSTTILDPEGERLFQQAFQALTQNNPIRAEQLLREIYARNSDYRFIEKVANLQRRVDSVR